MRNQDIEPFPLYAGPAALGLSTEEYLAGLPCVKAYLGGFPPEVDAKTDFEWGLRFLARYTQTVSTFNIYRTFVERLLLWSWIFLRKPARALNRNEFNQFVTFCKKPPSSWVGTSRSPRFIESERAWSYSGEWRPFVAQNKVGKQTEYQPLTSTIRQIQSICSSFYNFLHEKNATGVNPTVAPRLRSARSEKYDHPPRHSLSEEQLSRVLRVLVHRAECDPTEERVLFIVAATVYLCLKATDLAKSDHYVPSLDNFVFDTGKWWLILDCPRSLPRKIEVSTTFLPYLKRYRASLGLTELAEKIEHVPLLETSRGRPGLSARQISDIVRAAFKNVFCELSKAGESDADEWRFLLTSNLSSLRYSGAIKDAQSRKPAELQRHLGSTSLSYVYGRYYRT